MVGSGRSASGIRRFIVLLVIAKCIFRGIKLNEIVSHVAARDEYVYIFIVGFTDVHTYDMGIISHMMTFQRGRKILLKLAQVFF